MLLSIVAVTGVATAPAHAAKAFDLKVRTVTAPPKQAVPGSAFTLRVTVGRAGSGLRSAGFAAFLSRDAKRSRGDIAVTAAGSLTALRRKRAVKPTVRLTIPPGATPGAYRLLVCVDRVRGRRKDRRRGNDCRVAGKLTVLARPFVASPPLVAPGPVTAVPGPTSPPASGGTGDAGTDGGVAGFPRQADPLSVTAEFEDDAAVTQVVTATGAVLETDGADGTHFKLTIPADALAGATAITMTPVSALSDQPALGRFIAGARLEPEGLVLGRPAVLEITPPQVPPASLTGFEFHEAGEDVHRYPSRRSSEGAAIVFDLPHFSSPSASTGADTATLDRHPPSRPAGQFEQEAARALEDGAREEADTVNRLHDLTIAYYDGVVRPAINAAYADLTQAPAAAAAAMAWARQAQLLGLEDEPKVAARIDEAIDAVHELLRRVVAASDEACRNHDLDMIATLMSLERQAKLLGIRDAGASDKAHRCANFEVDLNSRLDIDDSSGAWSYETQTLDIPVGIDGPTGSSQLRWLAFTGGGVSSMYCAAKDEDGDNISSTYRSTPEGTIASSVTARLDMTFNARMPGTPRPPGDRSAELILDTGSPKEVIRWTLDPPGRCEATGTFEITIWEWTFALGHPGVRKAPPLTVVSGWESGSQARVLSRTFAASTATWREETTIDVWHTPLP